MRQLFYLIDLVLKKILGGIIKLYRLAISPLLGNNCRFHPTCSRYALDALSTKSFFNALPLILKRVSKCHPFNSGGYDPVE